MPTRRSPSIPPSEYHYDEDDAVGIDLLEEEDVDDPVDKAELKPDYDFVDEVYDRIDGDYDDSED
jgi:hypothetical protein